MKLTIISPEKIICEGETAYVTVPGGKGPFEILRGHAPIISNLQKGVIYYDNKGKCSVKINSGFVEVANDNVTACVEIAK